VTQVDREPGGGLVPRPSGSRGRPSLTVTASPFRQTRCPVVTALLRLYGFDNVRLEVHNTSQDQVILGEVNVVK